MTLSLIFIFLLVLENLLLPALIGAESFLIVPLFAISTIIYTENIKSRLIQALLFLLIEEYFSGIAIGGFIVPFMLTAGIYIWLNLFLNISSNLREEGSILNILVSVLILLLFLYVYSALFIFFRSSYDIFKTWEELKILVTTSVFQLSGWAIIFSVLFKYVIKRSSI